MNRLKNIMIVDDDEVANFIHSDLIESLGITDSITTLPDGADAYEYLEKAYSPTPERGFTIPDLIFLDVNMPILGGFEFMEKFNARFGQSRVKPVIYMLSTSFIKSDVERTKKFGQLIKGYLEKPLKNKDLVAILPPMGITV